MAAPKTTRKPGKHIDASALQQSVILSIDKLQPNNGQIPGVPANPRNIDKPKFAKLKQSIEDDPEMLSLREVLVYKQGDANIIIGGNMRFRAMKELGYADVICKFIPQETPAEKLRAIVIKDNNNYGEFDMDALANLWNTEELDRWGIDLPPMDANVEEDEAQEDNFNPDSVSGKAKAHEGDIYRLGRHRLICGDSTEAKVIEILMGGESADLLLTDPPYNVDHSSKNEALNAADKGNLVQKDITNDKMEDGNFQEFLFKAFSSIDAHLKPGGAFYIWHAGTEGLNFKQAVKRTGWDLKQILIWVKNNIVLGRQDYQWKHEPCLYGWKPGASHYFVSRRDLITVTEEGGLDVETLTKQELKDLLKEILNIPTTTIHEDKPLRSADHPTMKPLKLMGRLIKNSTRPGEIVLDTFGGSGSTMMAAEQLGRKCYMVELDPCYIDVIIKRYEDLTGDKAELLGNFKTQNA